MSAIFLSHSSADAEAATRVAQALAAAGFASVFLDFDPELGIPPGREWERELYARLRAAKALVVLCSPASMESRWVFAEITHAKALGKPVFPVRLGLTALPPILGALQWTAESDLERLVSELRRREVVDPAFAFSPALGRSPYPGLQAFEHDDAGLFFGRDAEVEAVLARLRRWRSFGTDQVFVLIGPSGSGKSSLLRAGVLPRLAREGDDWLVPQPLRPQPRPFPRTDPFRELASSLAQTFAAFGAPREMEDLLRRIRPEAEPPLAADPIEAIAEDLRRVAGRERATVILALDQLEELLRPHAEVGQELPASAACTRFLARIAGITRLEGSNLIVVATLRSDFLADLQHHAAGKLLQIEAWPVGPLAPAQWARIVEGPAERCGLVVEPELTRALISDTAHPDALPLLAFALRELWDRRGARDVLTLAAYREQLGGLGGAIATVAEDVFGRCRLAEREERALRRALSLLVSVDGSHYVRRTARLQDLPAEALPAIERFVAHRLLVRRAALDGEAELEVAHEALFRTWQRLAQWLADESDFLTWRRRLEDALREWQRTGDAFLRGAALAEAQRWRDDERWSALTEAQRELVERSSAEAVRESERWKEAYDRALARQLVAQAELLRSGGVLGLERAALLAIEAARRQTSVEADVVLRHVLEVLPDRWLGPQVEGLVRAVAFDPGGRWVAAGTDAGEVLVCELESGAVVARLAHPQAVRAIAVDAGADRVTTLADDAVRVWQVRSTEVLGTSVVPRGATRPCLRADGRFAAWSERTSLVLLEVASGTERRLPLAEPVDPLGGIAFAGDSVVAVTSAARRGGQPGGGGSAEMLLAWRLVDATPRWELACRGRFLRLCSSAAAEVVFLSDQPDGLRTAARTRGILVETGAVLWEEAGIAESCDESCVVLTDQVAKSVTPGVALGQEKLVVRRDARSGSATSVPLQVVSAQIAGLGNRGHALALRGTGGTRIVDLRTGVTAAWTDAALGAELAPDRAALCGADGASRLVCWRAPAAGPGSPVTCDELPGHLVSIPGVGFAGWAARVFALWDRDGRSLRSWRAPGNIKRVAVARGAPRIAVVTESVTSISSTGSTRSGADAALLVDLAEENRWRKVELPEGTSAVALDSGGTHVAVGSKRGQVSVHALEPPAVRLAEVVARPVAAVRLDAAARFVAAIGMDPEGGVTGRRTGLWVWELGSREPILACTDPVADAQFSADGRWLAYAAGERVRLQSISGVPGPVELALAEEILGLEPVEGGHWLCARGRSRVFVIDLDEGSVRHALAHDAWVAGVRACAGGQRVLIWSGANVSLFELATGRELARIPRVRPIRAVAAIPDTELVAVASDDGVFRAEQLDTRALARAARERLQRGLTREEWQSHVGEEPGPDHPG